MQVSIIWPDLEDENEPLNWAEIDLVDGMDAMRIARVRFTRAARAELLNEHSSRWRRKSSFRLYEAAGD